MAREEYIESARDLARHVGTSVNGLEKAIFKHTTCGAYLEFYSGVVVGSIVEGVDEGTEAHRLDFPFHIKDFWRALEKVEQEADMIWMATHGCEQCGEEGIDAIGEPTGYRRVNPDCQGCGGSGVVI
jgi:hypothetical protein